MSPSKSVSISVSRETVGYSKCVRTTSHICCMRQKSSSPGCSGQGGVLACWNVHLYGASHCIWNGCLCTPVRRSYLFLHARTDYSTLHHSTLQCSTQLYSTHSTMPYFSTLLCSHHSTLQCSTLLYSTLLYNVLLCSTLLYSTMFYSALLYSTMFYSALLYSTLLYNVLLYSTLLYNALLCSTLLYNVLLCSTLLYSTMFYSFVVVSTQILV